MPVFPSNVFVLDKKKRPLMPCHPARARELLRRGEAVVHRLIPFTIRLKTRDSGDVEPMRVLLDPGSKTTGIAVVREVSASTPPTSPAEPVLAEKPLADMATGPTRHVLWAAELTHRGAAIHKQMEQRAGYRRRRRSANLRYRQPRFDNRTKPVGWLAPSLRHRVETTVSWITRLCRWTPVSALSMELVRFDMAAMQTPDIEGVAYQQGTLAGYETREYLLEKWGRRCAYCDTEAVPLQIEHIVPRASGGSNRVSNLTLACERCNQKKAAQPVAVFLKKDPVRLAKILAFAKRPLRDAAAVNATRWVLREALLATGLPVDTASGGRTKYNRTRLGVAKSHAGDALCVGNVGAVAGWPMVPPWIKATGRGDYQRTRVTASGFPRGYLMQGKSVHGFRTGDLVCAIVPKGKKAGIHTGRVAVRATGSFNVKTAAGVVQGIGHKHCRLLQRADGYSYGTNADNDCWGASSPA